MRAASQELSGLQYKQRWLAYRVDFTFLFVPQILEQNRELLLPSIKDNPGFEKKKTHTLNPGILDFIGLKLLCFLYVSSSTVLYIQMYEPHVMNAVICTSKAQ